MQGESEDLDAGDINHSFMPPKNLIELPVTVNF